jgi:hypothetical protein
MSKSQQYIERAQNCAELAEGAKSPPARKRYKRMEAGWRALANEEQWLEGEVAPQGGPPISIQPQVSPVNPPTTG